MFLGGHSSYDRYGQQRAQGPFLALFSQKPGGEIRACVRHVKMRQLGHFMSGELTIRSPRAKAENDPSYGKQPPWPSYKPYVADGVFRIYVEGTYGDNGLTIDVDRYVGLWETLHPLPAALTEMMWKDKTGHNSAGSEGPSVRQWAIDNIKALRREYVKTLHLTPAFGRDYRSKKEIEGSLKGDLDFIINEIGHPYDGKPINLPQIKEAGYTHLNVRFSQNRKICVVKVADLKES